VSSVKVILQGMKLKWLFLLPVLAVAIHPAYSQEFRGVVKKVDSLVIPVYQARVEVKMEISKRIDTLQTNMDGEYFFALQKGQKYSVRISYPGYGYADTSFTFSTDKKGSTTAKDIIVQLKRDGITIAGGVRGVGDNFPVRDAMVILKNVMTREEHRVTTGVGGYFSFRLDYENNYRLSVDKYSPGILNKYRDTSFYISTIGFNRPADFMLNIYLEEDHARNTEPMEGYDPTKPTANQSLKPSVDVVHKTYKSSSPTQQIPVQPVVAAPASPPPAPVAVESSKPVQQTRATVPPIETQKPARDTMPVAPPPAEEKKPAIESKPVALPTEVRKPVKRAKSLPITEIAPAKSLSQLKGELKTAQKQLGAIKKQQADLAKMVKAIKEADEKKKKGNGKELQVQVIRDEPRLPGTKLTAADLARQQLDAENKIKQIEDDLAALKSTKVKR